MTEQCLLNHDRNPDLNREQIEENLRNYLGCDTVIWLEHGVYLDETKGHTDNFCRFVAPGEVILTWTDDQNDPQYPISTAALMRLNVAADAHGRKLTVHKLYQPSPVLISAAEAAGVDQVEGTLPRTEGDRLAASYVNFYIANGVIVMPAFDDPMDLPAQQSLAKLFPSRKIIAVPGREILLGGGNVHCITQQQPLALPASLRSVA
ncbi:Agmatine deiminase (plasmid) [Asticcacaulis sp. MM231]